MNYTQILNSSVKEIIAYITEQINSLNSLFGVNESSLSNSLDTRQNSYVIAKKDDILLKNSLSGINLDSSLEDTFYINPKDVILHRSTLSGSNTDVLGVSSIKDGLTLIDQNSIAITTTFLVSATNTEVAGTVASFSGITSIVENRILTLNVITTATNTEVPGISSGVRGITNVPRDNTFNFWNLSAINTNPPQLSSGGIGIVRVPNDSILYGLNLSGSNTELFDLSSDGNNLIRVPNDNCFSSFLLSSYNTQISGVYSLSTGIIKPFFDEGFPSISLSGINLLYNNLSTGNELISCKNYQFVETAIPSISLSGINLLYNNLSTGNELISGRNYQLFDEGFPSISLSGINLLYNNLSTGNELISCKNYQFVEAALPSISLSGINSSNPNFLILPLSYSEPDADAYITKIEAADGQLLEISVKNAIKGFVSDLKKNNLWGAITDCLILAGARTLSGALIALKGPNPTSTGFNSSNYNRKRLQGNGSAFLNLNRFNSNYGLTDHHIVLYKTAAATSEYIFGDDFGSLTRPINLVSNGSSQHRNANVFTPPNVGERTGFLGLIRTSSPNYTIRYNSTNQTSLTRTASNDNSNRPLYLFKAGSSGASSAGISFYSQGTGTSMDLALYQILVDKLIFQLNSYV